MSKHIVDIVRIIFLVICSYMVGRLDYESESRAGLYFMVGGIAIVGAIWIYLKYRV